jgi:DNA-binding transcriptional ArsR family regulator
VPHRSWLSSARAERPCCQQVRRTDFRTDCARAPQRPLLTPIQAGGLAAVFKVLANNTRLRLLHAIVRADEICVTDLATTLAMKPQAVSNQLQRLSDLGILKSRRDGKSILYRLVDPCVMTLLDQGLCLMEDAHDRTTRPATNGR